MNGTKMSASSFSSIKRFQPFRNSAGLRCSFDAKRSVKLISRLLNFNRGSRDRTPDANE